VCFTSVKKRHATRLKVPFLGRKKKPGRFLSAEGGKKETLLVWSKDVATRECGKGRGSSLAFPAKIGPEGKRGTLFTAASEDLEPKMTGTSRSTKGRKTPLMRKIVGRSKNNAENY